VKRSGKASLIAKAKPRFVDPMLLLRTDTLPEGLDWGYEIELDGYRAVALKTGGKVSLRSRILGLRSGRLSKCQIGAC
jgi:ATP-dependent DNA ligase